MKAALRLLVETLRLRADAGKPPERNGQSDEHNRGFQVGIALGRRDGAREIELLLEGDELTAVITADERGAGNDGNEG